MPSELAPLDAPAPMGRAKGLHPLTLLFAALDEGRALALPALAGGAWAAGGHMARMLVWVLVLLVIPAVIWAVAAYLAFRYQVTGASLVLDSGVWRRQHRVIPLARVQNIDLKQSALQRVLGVAEVHVETAGGDSSEAALSVLGIREAEALRAHLSALRVEAANVEEQERTLVARLSTRDLLLTGATANEAGIIAALLIGAAQLASELQLDLPLPGVDWPALVLEQSTGALVRGVVVVGLALLLLAWAFSVLGAVLNYAGFTLERAGPELHKRYGSLVRREATVPLERVQVIRIEESLLRRPLGLAAFKIETAATAPGKGQHRGAEAFLPLARATEASRLVAEVFEGIDYDTLQFRPVDPLARRRAFVRYSLALLVLTTPLVAFAGARGLWALALLPAAYAAAHLHYRSLGYAVSAGFIAARGGWLNRVTWVIPLRRVQTLHESATVFQRRHGLATVVVDTAAGGARVPNLRAEAARELLDHLAEGVVHPPGSEAHLA
ncbi:MAG: PH domain-containing protein [Gemmatimonadota bacterium]